MQDISREYNKAASNHHLGKHRFPGAWWAKQQHTSPRLADSLEKLGQHERQHDGFLQKLLGTIQRSDIIERNAKVVTNDIALHQINDMSVVYGCNRAKRCK